MMVKRGGPIASYLYRPMTCGLCSPAAFAAFFYVPALHHLDPDHYSILINKYIEQVNAMQN